MLDKSLLFVSWLHYSSNVKYDAIAASYNGNLCCDKIYDADGDNYDEELGETGTQNGAPCIAWWLNFSFFSIIIAV